MKQWVSEAKYGDSEGIAWLAYEDPEGFLTTPRLVGWAAVFEGELSVYVKPSERRRGIGGRLLQEIGEFDYIQARPHDRIGERFFQRYRVPIAS